MMVCYKLYKQRLLKVFYTLHSPSFVKDMVFFPLASLVIQARSYKTKR